MPSFLPKPTFPRLQPGHPLSNGLVAAWLMYEGQGETTDAGVIHDVSSLQATGVTQRGGSTRPTWTTGPYGYEMSFDGSSGYFTSTNSYNITDIFSIGAVFSTTESGNYKDIIRRDFGSGAGRTGIMLRKTSANKMQMEVFDTAISPLDVTSAGTYNDGLYHVAICTYNRLTGAGVLYVDNTVATGSKTLNSLSSAATAWGIGAFYNQGAPAEIWSGRISNICMWNRVLSADDVAAFTFDPFSMFRRRSRWWETVVGAAVIYTPPPRKQTIFIDRVRRV